MSTALAIAGVTAVLRDLLNDGLINNNITGVIGSTVNVSVLPPDRVVPNGGVEASQINLFLHQVTLNAGLRNEALPSRDPSGRHRLSNAPLALNLHYLVSAYSGGDLHAEILLGYAMQLLHENPVLTRQAIVAALNPSPQVGTSLPPALRALSESGLENQIEQIKITPEHLDADSLSKIWTATQSHLRPTAAYMASVVLIEAARAVRSALPVLTRGAVDPDSGRERGVAAEASLLPAMPTLTAVVPPGSQPAARLGETIELSGHHLDGTARTVVLANDRFAVAQDIAAMPGDAADSILFSLPVAEVAELPVGLYRVGARVTRPGEATPRESNALALLLAPELTDLPAGPVARDVGGTATFTIGFRPMLRQGQRATLFLGAREFAPQSAVAPVSTLNFSIADAPVGSHLARLRIDGVDSPIVDRSVLPPVFLDRRIVIT